MKIFSVNAAFVKITRLTYIGLSLGLSVSLTILYSLSSFAYVEYFSGQARSHDVSMRDSLFSKLWFLHFPACMGCTEVFTQYNCSNLISDRICHRSYGVPWQHLATCMSLYVVKWCMTIDSSLKSNTCVFDINATAFLAWLYIALIFVNNCW